MNIIKSDGSVGDCCIFCGEHPDVGHYFEAVKQDELENYVTKHGWLVIEYTSRAYVWLCPRCQTKSYQEIKQEMVNEFKKG